jgi:5'-nucleotidase
MSKKQIFVDMDGILTDLMAKWLKVYNEEHDDTVTPADITDWELHRFAKKVAEKDFYAIVDRKGFFDDLEPIPGAVEGFKALRRSGHHVVVLSSPFNADSARAKYAWCGDILGLDKHDVMLMHKKPWLAGEGRILIDDKPRHLIAWEKAGGEGATITYEYNRDTPVTHRADSYAEPEKAWQKLVELLT